MNLTTSIEGPVADAARASRQNDAHWWRGATIYQIYPRSFADSDGDGVGDLRGATDRLDHVASLGVDGIWLSPFFTSPMADFGYDVSDYCDVDPLFGTLDDFDALVARAHELGLKVIIDQVYCHSSDRHPWFAASRKDGSGPYSDWYVWADARPDGTPPNNWLSVFGGPAWTWCAQRKQYYLHHFLKEQPALNLHNDAVVAALIDVGRFWIERGVDGFRLDALNMGMHDLGLRDNPPHPDSAGMSRTYDMQRHEHSMSHPGMVAVVERFAKAFREAGGDAFFTVAELGGADPFPTMVAYTQGHDRLSTAYSFDFIGVREVDTDYIRGIVSKWSNSLTEGYPAFALSNHDMPRVASRWAVPGAPEDVVERLLALFECAVRGVVFIYQGEELGLPQVDIPFEDLVDPEAIANWPEDQGRDGARTPMPWSHEAPSAGFSANRPWLPVPPSHIRRAVDLQDDDPDSILQFFRAAIALRQAEPVLRYGSSTFFDVDPECLCFVRALGDDKALCAINFGAKPARLPETLIGERWTVRLAAGHADPAIPHIAPFSGYVATIGEASQ